MRVGARTPLGLSFSLSSRANSPPKVTAHRGGWDPIRAFIPFWGSGIARPIAPCFVLEMGPH